VTTNQLGVSPAKWQTMSPRQQKKLKQDYRNILVYQQRQVKLVPRRAVSLSVSGGEAMMPPFVMARPFSAAFARVPAGGCENLALVALNHAAQVNLTACYIGGVLALDPSHTDVNQWQGTVFFNDNPVWQQGFTYRHVASLGYVRLNNTNITIKYEPAQALTVV
jgi:hypothetical protein